MTTVALICPQCGAPLPEAARHGSAGCEYCGAAVVLRGTGIAISVRGEAAHDPEAAARRRQEFYAAVKAASIAGTDPYHLLCDAARKHLGVVGESDTLARVVIALASDFERETGAAVTRDPMVLSRLSEAYLKASTELRSLERTTMNLPFLAATPQGPVHLMREVSVVDLVALASREPTVAPAPAAAAAAAPEPPKKKGWWPF